MKINKFLLIFLCFFFYEQLVEAQEINHFSATKDTLILSTKKVKGFGKLEVGGGSLNFSDTSNFKDFQITYPSNISKLKVGYELIDFKYYWYNSLKSNKSEYLNTFFKDYVPQKFDTINIPANKDNSIVILTGEQGGQKVFIVDENNNKDLRDDSIRFCNELGEKSINNRPIKIKYNIYNGKRFIEDSGWITLSSNATKEHFFFFVAQHLEAHFMLDEHLYELQIINEGPLLRFCFENPIGAIVGNEGVVKDTLLESEKISKGEYFKMANKYYQFADVSNDGRFVTLILENDVSNKIGTQVGFIAPMFNCCTIDNDSIKYSNYKGKYLLLANVSACWSEKSSYECFKELNDAYGAQISILGIDNSPNFLKQNIKTLKLNGSFVIADNNPTIKSSYRKDFCSRTCFLINPEGRIIDKFEIFDWKARLDENIGAKK